MVTSPRDASISWATIHPNGLPDVSPLSWVCLLGSLSMVRDQGSNALMWLSKRRPSNSSHCGRGTSSSPSVGQKKSNARPATPVATSTKRHRLTFRRWETEAAAHYSSEVDEEWKYDPVARDGNCLWKAPQGCSDSCTRKQEMDMQCVEASVL